MAAGRICAIDRFAGTADIGREGAVIGAAPLCETYDVLVGDDSIPQAASSGDRLCNLSSGHVALGGLQREENHGSWVHLRARFVKGLLAGEMERVGASDLGQPGFTSVPHSTAH